MGIQLRPERRCVYVPAVRRPDGSFIQNFQPGEYKKVWVTQEADGQEKSPQWQWWMYPPDGKLGVLTQHAVTEHLDGSVSVTPSILQVGTWHGWLVHGQWEEVDYFFGGTRAILSKTTSCGWPFKKSQGRTVRSFSSTQTDSGFELVS